MHVERNVFGLNVECGGGGYAHLVCQLFALLFQLEREYEVHDVNALERLSYLVLFKLAELYLVLCRNFGEHGHVSLI